MAHRVSYQLNVGAIPDGLYVLHSCDNPGCVNPAHLRAGSAKENTHDAISRGRLINPPKMAGAKNHKAKLNAEQLAFIKANPHLPRKQLAALFNVTYSTIRRVLIGESWKD